jgi:hypothetical protein
MAASAFGSTWNGHQLDGEAAKAKMYSVSCPSASLCVAVGSNNTVASTSEPGSGGWSAVYVGEGAIPTGSNFHQLRGVSCPSTVLCVAVSYDGIIYTSTDPTGTAQEWSVADLSGDGPNIHLFGVSCPTAAFCVAVAGQGKILTSTNPTGGPAAWSVTELSPPLEARGVSCLSSSFCLAVGDNGDRANPIPSANGEILTSSDPLAGTWARIAMPGGTGPLYGASCPSPGLCVSGNLLGNLLVSSNPTGAASAWPETDGGGSVQITDVDCLDTSRCVAVDNNGDVLTSTDPAGGAAAWTFTNVAPFPPPGVLAPGNGMFGVSCPSISLCAVAAADGQLFTSSDPFALAPSTPGSGGSNGSTKKKRHRKLGPKRPGTTIAHPPLLGIETNAKKVRARTFFYARHHVRVAGFLCSIDGRKPKPCRSPKTFVVGLGRHVVRIQAIGQTGLRGPAAVARFKVCRPHTHGFCTGAPTHSPA